MERPDAPPQGERVVEQSALANVSGLDRADLPRILSELPFGVAVVDRQRRTLVLNRALESLTGFSTADVAGVFCRHVLRGSFCLHGCPSLPQGGGFLTTGGARDPGAAGGCARVGSRLWRRGGWGPRRGAGAGRRGGLVVHGIGGRIPAGGHRGSSCWVPLANDSIRPDSRLDRGSTRELPLVDLEYHLSMGLP